MSNPNPKFGFPQIPYEIARAFEKELTGVSRGEVKLNIFIRDGKFSRYSTENNGVYLETGYSGKLPDEAASAVLRKLDGTLHGAVRLVLYIADGGVFDYEVTSEKSHLLPEVYDVK
jgi:hypothetical protein